METKKEEKKEKKSEYKLDEFVKLEKECVSSIMYDYIRSKFGIDELIEIQLVENYWGRGF